MLWTKTLIPTLKEIPQEAETESHRLLLRAGLARMLMAGVYSYLPLGLRVLRNIEQIIRQEMNACSAAELLLPAWQPLELWQKSGRDKDLAEVMVKFIDRRGRKVCLGPTHEEVITDLVKNHVSSYKQLPLVLYQIQTKFRDEIRPRFGLIRGCEFLMKDAYSFDRDEAGLDKNYREMHEAYLRIFKRCGLNILVTEADPGAMGGNFSHEFMVPAKDGEDVVLSGGEKLNCIEVGHIFKLGDKYSASLGANFLDEKGKLRPVIMGCYGIGVSRLISAVIEQNYDEKGIIWPKEVAPFQVAILSLDSGDEKIKAIAGDFYRELAAGGIEALLDDRDERAGIKFKDADLVGIPLQVVIGKKAREENTIEIKIRRGNGLIVKPRQEASREVERILLSHQ
ncbi:MAG: proline--tRNA ligase [Candidatus Omnitrophota bacterium]|nr:proline--tRNA ligase [Candidatus Omnitrophota bacterium]